jgi:homospermidine synthase
MVEEGQMKIMWRNLAAFTLSVCTELVWCQSERRTGLCVRIVPRQATTEAPDCSGARSKCGTGPQGVGWRIKAELEDSPDRLMIALEWPLNHSTKEGCSQDWRAIQRTWLVQGHIRCSTRSVDLQWPDYIGQLVRAHWIASVLRPDHSDEYVETCSF